MFYIKTFICKRNFCYIQSEQKIFSFRIIKGFRVFLFFYEEVNILILNETDIFFKEIGELNSKIIIKTIDSSSFQTWKDLYNKLL